MQIAPQLKYGLFFISIALGLTLTLINSWRSWIIIYPIVNSLVMSLAYFNNMPSLILGKRENGRINDVLFLINAPWLFVTWLIWVLGAVASRENKIDLISGTNVYIGQIRDVCFQINLRIGYISRSIRSIGFNYKMQAKCQAIKRTIESNLELCQIFTK